MTDPRDSGASMDPRVGLCFTCKYGQRVTSSRASAFWLCERSTFDPTYPKYPRLPVMQCAGYETARSD